MKEIKAYKCDFCNKYSKSEPYIKNHEKKCYYNATTKSCATCINLGSGDHTYMKQLDEGGEIKCHQTYPICLIGEKLTKPLPNDEPIFGGFDLKTNCDHWFQRVDFDEEYK